MPELPEAETIRRELQQAVVGKRIVGVAVGNAKVIREPSKSAFVKGVRGVSIEGVFRKGKALIFELSNKKFLITHLRMTGQFVYPGNGQKARVSFTLSNGKKLDFNDRRLLGELRLVDNWKKLAFFKTLGPEIYDLEPQAFSKMLSGKTAKIKPLLMDQAFLAGVGNLYAAEALFRSKIHPARPACSLSEKEKQGLCKEIKDTLDEAIKHKGSSVDQYVQLSGDEGGYAPYHRVYGRKGQTCLRCKTKIQRISLGGRGTYFCPKCQR